MGDDWRRFCRSCETAVCGACPPASRRGQPANTEPLMWPHRPQITCDREATILETDSAGRFRFGCGRCPLLAAPSAPIGTCAYSYLFQHPCRLYCCEYGCRTFPSECGGTKIGNIYRKAKNTRKSCVSSAIMDGKVTTCRCTCLESYCTRPTPELSSSFTVEKYNSPLGFSALSRPIFLLHDDGPAKSSYPGLVSSHGPAVASAVAVGSAPLLRRGRATV